MLGRSRSPKMLSIPLVIMYRPSGAHFTYAHVPNLRETPTRHVYPLPFEQIRGLGGIMASCLVVETGEEWETRLSKR